MSGESRGKRRHHDHEEHEEHVNHEAWVIPYADVLTLLMALFLVLWALGDPNPDKTNIAAESFRRELGGRGGISDFDIGFGTGGGPLANGGVSVLEGAGPAPMATQSDPNANAAAVSEQPDDGLDSGVFAGMPPTDIGPGDPRFDPLSDGSATDQADESEEMDEPDQPDESTAEDEIDDPGDGSGSGDGGDADVDPLDQIEQAVRDEAVGSGLSTSLGFRREERGLVVSIVSDSVLFTPGDADVQESGKEILAVIADALIEKPNSIIVEGHTDSRPISTPRFPSNWELSTERATSVLRFLSEDLGIPGSRLSAAGYADTRPLAEGDDTASLARNRRVEIVVIG